MFFYVATPQLWTEQNSQEEHEMSACFRTRASQAITPLMVIRTMAEYGFCDYTLNAAAKVQY